MVGLEYRPGYFAKGVKILLGIMFGLIITLGCLAIIPSVPLIWVRLWGIFVGDPEMLPRAMGNSDEG